jgi:hypothetical protein
MPTASPVSAALFGALTLLVAVVVGAGFRRAGAGPAVLVGVLLLYLLIPGLLAREGRLDRYDPLPAPALLLIAGLTILTGALVVSPVGRRLAAGLGLGAVIALQAFRIPVELMLHRLYLEGAVPVQMTYAGRNLDVLTGVTGLLLGGWMLLRRRAPRAVVIGWNLLGLALLVNIIGIAVLSAPVPFRRFTDGPPNLLPSTFPYVWLPSFLVQVALGSHLLVFRQLREWRGSLGTRR